MRQDEPQPRVLDLLVAAHRGQQLVGRERPVADVGQPCRQPQTRQVGARTVEVRGRAMSEPGGQRERLDHADGHRLAVQQSAVVARQRLVGMGEGVAEIEQRALAGGLALVGGDDRGLDLERAADRLRARCGIAGQQGGAVQLEPVEQARRRRGSGRI